MWSSDVLSLMEIKPCQRLSCQVKRFQKTNDQPAYCYPWQYYRTFIQRFFRGLRSRPGSDKLSKSKHLANSSLCMWFWKQGLGFWCIYKKKKNHTKADIRADRILGGSIWWEKRPVAPVGRGNMAEHLCTYGTTLPIPPSLVWLSYKNLRFQNHLIETAH